MLKKRTGFGAVLGIGAVALLAVACSGNAANSGQETRATGVVAQGVTRDGAELTIESLADGSFVVTRESKTMSLPVLEPSSDLAELFEIETGEVPPAALVRALNEARVAPGREQSEAEDTPGTVEASSLAEPTSYDMSAAEFEDRYCDNVDVCLTRRTNRLWQQTSKAVFVTNVVVHPYRGDVKFIGHQYRFGDWEPLVTRTVLEGRTLEISVHRDAVLSKYLAAEVKESDGDGFHFSMIW